MRSIVILLVSFLSFSGIFDPVFAQSNRLDYQFERRDSTSLVITVSFDGTATGKTRFHLPDNLSGQQRLYMAFSAIQALSEKTTITATSRPDEYLISYDPGAKVVLSYILSQGWNGPLKYPYFYRPIINKELFYFPGYAALAYPDVAPTIHCKISYEGFATGIFLGNSFFSNKADGEFELTLDDVINGIYCAGNFRNKTIYSGDRKITVAVAGAFEFTDESAFEAVAQILTDERKFWKEKGSPYYFALLMPTADKGSNAGTAYYNSFSLFASPDVQLTGGILQTISHEYFHNWLGRGLKNPAPEESYKWFSEGFTDYYSLKILFKAGIISKGDFLKQMNRKIKSYYLSALFNSRTIDIVGKFWQNDAWRLLSYQRGLTIAFTLDAMITENKNGSLDDLLRSFYEQSKPDLLFSKVLFDKQVVQFAGIKASAALDSAINGENSLLTKQLTANKIYPVAMKMVSNSYDVGFDIAQSKSARKILGLVPGSSAAQAGLKEGMPFVAFHYKSNTDEPATVVVMDNGTKREISYIPLETGSAYVPQIIENISN